MKTFVNKLAVAARLAANEVQRIKLARYDLARADLALGEQAYTSGNAYGQADLVSKLDLLTQGLKQLRQRKVEPTSTFADKAKAFASKNGRAVQAGVLQLKRRRLLRQLGGKIRQSGENGSLAERAHSARSLADRINCIETQIRQLTSQTYPWARRPLLLVALLLLLTVTVGAFGTRHPAALRVAQQPQTGSSSSTLSDAAMNKILAQQQAFAQQTQQMQAEARRREVELTQERIAAVQRTQQEKWQAEMTAREKRLADQAAANRAREAQEAERDRVAEAEMKEAAQMAAAKEEQQRLEREKGERAEIEQQHGERERMAAETQRQQEEKARLEREEAEREAHERQQQVVEVEKTPAVDLISRSEIESIMGVNFREGKVCEINDLLSKSGLSGVEDKSGCFFESALTEAKQGNNGVRLTVRYLGETDVLDAEDKVRDALKSETKIKAKTIEDLGYPTFYVSAENSLFVLKHTAIGTTLLQVAIEGDPGKGRCKNEDCLGKQKEIALKILGPAKYSVASYEYRHEGEYAEDLASQMANQPGIPPALANLIRAAGKADDDNLRASKKAVRTSHGRLTLCPKCGGRKKAVQHYYDTSRNPYAFGTDSHVWYDFGRDRTTIANCPRCRGRGVVEN